MTIEKIKKKLALAENAFDKKQKKWDKILIKECKKTVYYENFHKLWERRNKFLKKEIEECCKLRMDLNMIISPSYSKIDKETGDVMSLEDFIDCCKSGGFIDDDGFGHYVHEKKDTNILIIPSYVMKGKIRKDFSEVIWFNK